MEAMASGALIFIDHMHTPRHHPLLQGVHVVYFDNNKVPPSQPAGLTVTIIFARNI